ncbi:melanophilin-like [Thalassophryne amazonica]|uniref:melanophilin-like n=1 Tax=Thalassophryne amazonica TaxID=390379 RepID=UPI001470A5C3|nr:melanophilin-like [Thalassophryne amazonica]
MPGTTEGQKLDLSKLTDEEAQHVWEVVQRDFDLRKKEEDRLGSLKTKIEKEDTKRELLANQSSLTDSYCIRCLQPFKFLVSNKRQCLDCRLFICQSCSRYNIKEHGWVCDPCRMARVLKIGTLEWYHENVRSRFKRFGSAKVMRYLFKRLNREHRSSQSDNGDPSEYDTESMPELHSESDPNKTEAANSEHNKRMKKKKRRLTVHPFDFDLDSDYSMDSRGQSFQDACSLDIMDGGVRESAIAAADDSVFHGILEDQHKDNLQYSDNRTVPFPYSLSQLSQSSYGSGSVGGHNSGPDDSEVEDYSQHYPPHHFYQGSCSHTSQESLNSLVSSSQITDLSRRMSAMETMLTRLEQVTSTDDQTPQASETPGSTSPFPQWDNVDQEEQQLQQKLNEMTNNISDRSLTSEEDESDQPDSFHQTPEFISEKNKDPHTDSCKMGHSTESLDSKWLPTEEGSAANLRGPAALLFELEDKIAQTAADVQNAQSEVSDIENRIAALNAAGMSVDKSRKRSAIPIPSRKLTHNFPTSQVEMFARNSIYRGSLTQRNPTAKPKKKITCAKPVMTHIS